MATSMLHELLIKIPVLLLRKYFDKYLFVKKTKRRPDCLFKREVKSKLMVNMHVHVMVSFIQLS